MKKLLLLSTFLLLSLSFGVIAEEGGDAETLCAEDRSPGKSVGQEETTSGGSGSQGAVQDNTGN